MRGRSAAGRTLTGKPDRRIGPWSTSGVVAWCTVLIACGQVGDDPDWPSIRAAFGAFLRKPAIAELLADMTHVGTDASWERQASNTSSIIDMVLGHGRASARLELPDGIRRHGRVEGYALLVLHVEPRGRAPGRPAREPVVMAAAVRAGLAPPRRIRRAAVRRSRAGHLW